MINVIKYCKIILKSRILDSISWLPCHGCSQWWADWINDAGPRAGQRCIVPTRASGALRYAQIHIQGDWVAARLCKQKWTCNRRCTGCTEYDRICKWRQGSRFLAENSKEKDKQQGIGCDAFATGRVFSTNWREDPVRTSTSDQKR